MGRSRCRRKGRRGKEEGEGEEEGEEGRGGGRKLKKRNREKALTQTAVCRCWWFAVRAPLGYCFGFPVAFFVDTPASISICIALYFLETPIGRALWHEQLISPLLESRRLPQKVSWWIPRDWGMDNVVPPSVDDDSDARGIVWPSITRTVPQLVYLLQKPAPQVQLLQPFALTLRQDCE